MKKKTSSCTKGYYCTVTISFRQYLRHGKPGFIRLMAVAIEILTECLCSRSLESGIPFTKVDYTCFRNKDLVPL